MMADLLSSNLSSKSVSVQVEAHRCLFLFAGWIKCMHNMEDTKATRSSTHMAMDHGGVVSKWLNLMEVLEREVDSFSMSLERLMF